MGAGGLTEDEIRDAIANAEAAKEADEKRAAHLVAKNKVQGFIFSLSRLNRENASVAPEDLISRTAPLIEKAEAVLANDDVTTEELEAMAAELSSFSRDWYDFIYAREQAEREQQEQEQQQQQQTAQQDSTNDQP